MSCKIGHTQLHLGAVRNGDIRINLVPCILEYATHSFFPRITCSRLENNSTYKLHLIGINAQMSRCHNSLYERIRGFKMLPPNAQAVTANSSCTHNSKPFVVILRPEEDRTFWRTRCSCDCLFFRRCPSSTTNVCQSTDDKNSSSLRQI